MRAESPARPTVTVEGKRISSHGGFTKREQVWLDVYIALIGTLGAAEARHLQGEAVLQMCKSATLATDFAFSYYNGKESQVEARIAEIEARLENIPTLGEQTNG